MIRANERGDGIEVVDSTPGRPEKVYAVKVESVLRLQDVEACKRALKPKSRKAG